MARCKNSRRISIRFMQPSKAFLRKLIVYLPGKTRSRPGLSTSVALTWRCYPRLWCNLHVKDAYSLQCAEGVVCVVRPRYFFVLLAVCRCRRTWFLVSCAEIRLCVIIIGARTVQRRLELVKMVYAIVVVATPLPLPKMIVCLCLTPR
jgi:hypothetical protein